MTVHLSHEKVDASEVPNAEGREGLVDLFRMDVEVTGPLTGPQEARLREIAGRCPVHRTLTGQPLIIHDLHVRVPGEEP